MSIVQAIVLGTLQGLTEFLPVSSSAHLYVVPTLLHWPYAGVAFDVALHWGTLVALLVAFGGDWMRLAVEPFRGSPESRAEARTFWLKLAVGSIPAGIAGVLLRGPAEDMLRNLPLQAAMLALFGLRLWAVDRLRPAGVSSSSPGWAATLTVGVAQALALVPGVSRSGVTITAGRLSGLDRVSAARFSFMLATPITFGAGLLELHHLSPGVAVPTLVAGVVSSAVVGLIAIRGLLRWLGSAGFGAFFAYRLVFALVIVATIIRR
jgi:undecaprenyl-diphosphatase